MENKQSHSLRGKNAIICGSTSGIGLYAAKEFAASGSNVTLFARDEIKLKKVIKELSTDYNQNHQYIVGNFDIPEDINNLIKENIKNDNSYHILINNSGGPKAGSIIDSNINDFLVAFNRHLICNHILATNLLPGMKKFKYGRIVNIISTSVKQPIQGLGVSNTIRGAVASWAKTLSFEVAKYGITVNNILPGFTKTERLSSLILSKAKLQNRTEEEIAYEMKKQIPVDRFGLPEETAKAIAFLSSPSASYINGVSLAVDGGRLTTI